MNPSRRGSGAGARVTVNPSGLSDHSGPKASQIQEIASLRKSRGGKRSRQKGDRTERALVRFLQDRRFAAERIPLSGSAGGRFSGDVSVPLLSIDRTVEVKCRANGFRELYAWLNGAALLIVRADRREPLVILPLRLAVEIAEAAERDRAGAP
jgi:Holliday junction resolvase